MSKQEQPRCPVCNALAERITMGRKVADGPYEPQTFWPCGHSPMAKLVVASKPVDISQYVAKLDLHGDSEAERNLAGLADGSLTIQVDNSDAKLTADLTRKLMAQTERRMRISYLTPDGRWQRVKDWLKRHHLAPRWLKVRYVTYSFDGQIAPAGADDIQMRAVSAIEKGTEQR